MCLELLSWYGLDAICAQNSFPGMGWTWSPKEHNVHIYCKTILECIHQGVMETMTDHFLIPLYEMIFEEEPPCMSCEAMETMAELVDWFASLDHIYLIVFGRQKSRHMLLRYAANKVVMQEVAYHLSIGLSRVLHRKKKAP